MEYDVADNLKLIGYKGHLEKPESLLKAAENGVKSGEIRDLVTWLVKRLTSLINLDSTVASITDNEDLASFIMEVGSLLKELGCPFNDLTEGPLSGRLISAGHCLNLLLFLSSEILAAIITKVEKRSNGTDVRISESSTARDLKNVMVLLKLPRPPENIPSKVLFKKIEGKLQETVSRAPGNLLGKPLFIGRLSIDQWRELQHAMNELNGEYRLRREVLLKRLDLTVKSFEWCEQVKGKGDSISKAFAEKRRLLTAEPSVAISDLIAARDDAAIIEKTSGSTARKHTTSSVHKVIIGRVPDRGGRTSEQEAPPPEMPSWQKERAQGGSGGGGGRGGGGGFGRGGGSRVQGGWNQRAPGQDGRGDGGNQRAHDGDRKGGRNRY